MLVDPHSSSLKKEYVVFFMLLLNGLHSNFTWMFSRTLHRAPPRYVDVPAESTVDLRGLTQTLVKKKESEKEKSATFSTVYVQTKNILKSTADSRQLRQKRLRVRERERPKKKDSAHVSTSKCSTLGWQTHRFPEHKPGCRSVLSGDTEAEIELRPRY